MKIYYFLIILLTQQYALLGQTTWYVSNRNDGVIVDFTNLQTAHNTASPGDTLIVYPSPYSYGYVTISKEIHITGLGFRTDTISQPSLAIKSFCPHSTTISLSLVSGADGTTINSCYLSTCTLNNVNNIKIQRCESAGVISLTNSSNNFIESCHILWTQYLIGGLWHVLNLYLNNSSNNNISNCIFTNNSAQFIHGNIYSSGNNSINNNISNNVFNDDIIVYNSNIFNNIIITNVNGAMNEINNNIFLSGDPSQNNNGNIYGATNVFVGYPTQGSYSFDARWQLQSNSPAIGAGVDGEDCGIFGGPNPYKLSGIHSRPLIYDLIVPQSVPDGSDLNITVKVRAEN